MTGTPGAEVEIPLVGGEVNTVVRVRNTVRRSPGPWTPAVHALLKHLEAVGFAGAPRVLGFDDRGREMLSYIDGVAATRPWPPELRTDDGLHALAELLREYHDAVAGFVPPRDAPWAVGPKQPAAGEVIRHGDYGPWNIIWRAGRPVGVIDWDMAEPGSPLLDLAQAALFAIPLQGPAGVDLAGFTEPLDLRHRLLVLCDGYRRYPADEVLAALVELQTLELDRVRRLGGQGIPPWAGFLARGKVAEFEGYRAWLADNIDQLHE
jgi:hypothetical protein